MLDHVPKRGDVEARASGSALVLHACLRGGRCRKPALAPAPASRELPARPRPPAPRCPSPPPLTNAPAPALPTSRTRVPRPSETSLARPRRTRAKVRMRIRVLRARKVESSAAAYLEDDIAADPRAQVDEAAAVAPGPRGRRAVRRSRGREEPGELGPRDPVRVAGGAAARALGGRRQTAQATSSRSAAVDPSRGDPWVAVEGLDDGGKSDRGARRAYRPGWGGGRTASRRPARASPRMAHAARTGLRTRSEVVRAGRDDRISTSAASQA